MQLQRIIESQMSFAERLKDSSQNTKGNYSKDTSILLMP